MDWRTRVPHFEPTEDGVPFATVENARREQETLLLDVYLPNAAPSGLRPVIMWIHGGGFRYGNDRHQVYVPWLSGEFAKRGYVCVAPDYRVRDAENSIKLDALADAVDDCRAALGWIRENARRLQIDPQRIYVGGGSAGGMTAASVCNLEHDIAGLANLWGSPAPGFMVGELSASYPPTIAVHGTADQLVDYANAPRYIANLEALSVPCKLVTLKNAPHTPLMHMDLIVESVDTFLREHGKVQS